MTDPNFPSPDPAPLQQPFGALPDDSQAQQADAWRAVCRTLHEVAPGWLDLKGTGQELAVATIRRLAAQAAIPAPEGAPSDQDIEALFLRSGGRWDGDRWVIEDADLHPFVRAALAAAAPQAARHCLSTSPAATRPDAHCQDPQCGILGGCMRAAPQAATVAWLMTADDDDGSADWVELGAEQPAPFEGFRAVPLGPMAAPQAAPVPLTDEQIEDATLEISLSQPLARWSIACAAVAEFCRVNGIPVPKEPKA